MKYIAAALLLGLTACANTQRTYLAQQHGSKLRIQSVAKSKNKTIEISFEAPVEGLKWHRRGDHFIILSSEIKNFHQERINEVGKTIGGGQPVDGFVAINYRENPETLELHLLTLSNCSCRHVELHEANGTYMKAKPNTLVEQVVAADRQPLHHFKPNRPAIARRQD